MIGSGRGDRHTFDLTVAVVTSRQLTCSADPPLPALVLCTALVAACSRLS